MKGFVGESEGRGAFEKFTREVACGFEFVEFVGVIFDHIAAEAHEFEIILASLSGFSGVHHVFEDALRHVMEEDARHAEALFDALVVGVHVAETFVIRGDELNGLADTESGHVSERGDAFFIDEFLHASCELGEFGEAFSGDGFSGVFVAALVEGGHELRHVDEDAVAVTSHADAELIDGVAVILVEEFADDGEELNGVGIVIIFASEEAVDGLQGVFFGRVCDQFT